MENLRDLLVLIRSATPASILRALLDRHGGAAGVLRAGRSDWREAGCRDEHIAALLAPDAGRIDSDLAWLAEPGRHLLGWHQADYPALLRMIASPPVALFVAGDPGLLWHPQIALVGTRQPSVTGQELAHEFAYFLAAAGLVVTSGLAEGVDTAAHRGALEAGRTIAVIGCGPDRAYPASNARLFDEIASHSAIVSEHPPGTAPLRQHFPSRNRLIAGLSLGTVVIEAAERSGALITARLAAEAGREVFALPGSVRNPMARGCHRLIRQGVSLIESPDEVMEALRPLASALAGQFRVRLQDGKPGTPSASSDRFDIRGWPLPEQRLWNALGHDRVGLDQLQQRSGLTLTDLSAMLLVMELDGRIDHGNGRYQRRGS